MIGMRISTGFLKGQAWGDFVSREKRYSPPPSPSVFSATFGNDKSAATQNGAAIVSMFAPVEEDKTIISEFAGSSQSGAPARMLKPSILQAPKGSKAPEDNFESLLPKEKTAVEALSVLMQDWHTIPHRENLEPNHLNLKNNSYCKKTIEKEKNVNQPYVKKGKGSKKIYKTSDLEYEDRLLALKKMTQFLAENNVDGKTILAEDIKINIERSYDFLKSNKIFSLGMEPCSSTRKQAIKFINLKKVSILEYLHPYFNNLNGRGTLYNCKYITGFLLGYLKRILKSLSTRTVKQ